MICENGPLAHGERSRIERVLSISGVHDLRPLRMTQMNRDLQLTEEEARRESVVCLNPAPGVPAILWVGASERPEFIRQSRALAVAWRSKTAVDLVIEPARHHFDVIDGLASPDAGISELLTQGG